tara:strand:+ start:4749 stop:5123 length:375 start_codon:yes stop_codon:yes gene_type:complete
MNTKLSYEEWRDNLPNLQNIINRTRNKNLRLKIFELREVKSSKQPKKREAFIKAIEEILDEMDSDDRDIFYGVFRNRKYMEGKCQIRITTTTREQLRSLMERHEWADYDTAVSELIEFLSANGG